LQSRCLTPVFMRPNSPSRWPSLPRAGQAWAPARPAERAGVASSLASALVMRAPRVVDCDHAVAPPASQSACRPGANSLLRHWRNGARSFCLGRVGISRPWLLRRAGCGEWGKGEHAFGTTPTYCRAICFFEPAVPAQLGARPGAHRTQPRRQLVLFRGGPRVAQLSAAGAPPPLRARTQGRCVRCLGLGIGGRRRPADGGR
jgi:hypothetical protein